MNDVGTMELLSIKPPDWADDPLRREQWAFYCVLGDLLKTHRGQHVAVHNRQVIAAGPDRMDVIRRAREQVGNVPIYVGFVSDEPPPVARIPRIRLLK
jgi:Family of unknown function (DUF5678)